MADLYPLPRPNEPPNLTEEIMEEKIEVNILTIVVVIDDFRHLSPNGETWGFYPVRVCGNAIEVNYDLVRFDGKDILL
jgi:hypothetical protein